MEASLLIFKKTLRRNFLSLTKPRLIIFKILESNEPLTIAEIYKACNAEIDRVTVYRTIGLFEKLQIIQKINIGWKYKIELSHPYQLHHHHLTCTICSEIIALPEDKILESRIKDLTDLENFVTIDHQIEIRGICVNCK